MCCIRAKAASSSTCMYQDPLGVMGHDTVAKDFDSPVQHEVNLEYVLAKHRWFMTVSLVLTAKLI